ncbi:MAG: acyl-CoA dehydratase activase [Bacillota bacterium]|nr:acyl-CoA dehydratase activase [Bacillota bacterium]
MITAGLDVGNKFVKVVILKDGEVAARGHSYSGFDQKKAAEDALSQALIIAGLIREDISYISATGAGKAEVTFANGTVTEVGAAARGVIRIFPEVRIVVDVGAEESRVLKIDEKGKVIDFAISDKCAAGTGSFLEAMSRTLEIPLEEMGPLSLEAAKSLPMNAQCAVFAESEVISLIHMNTSKPEIARSIHDAMASRISSMVRRVGLQKEMGMIGGVAKNPGFVRALERDLEVTILLPESHPDFVSALGAAIAAAEKIS